MPEQTIFPDFDRDFWSLYKKGSKKLSRQQWEKLSQKDREAAYDGIAPYFASRPEAKYRKDGERYLRHRTWEDNHGNDGTDTSTTDTARASGSGAHTKMREVLHIIARGSGRGDDDAPEGGIL